MAHLGWFFAGISCGLFIGVLVTSLAKISDMARAEESFRPRPVTSEPRLMLVRR